MNAQVTNFSDRLVDAQRRNSSLLCVGLDPDPSRFPESITGSASGSALQLFNRAIVEATLDIACCYKPNLGFYLPFGQDGIDALIDLRKTVPAHIPVLLDCKVGDIDTTSAAYAVAYFEQWGMDAITVNPFMGKDSLDPLMAYGDRGIFVLAKTSNAGSGFLQDQVLSDGHRPVSHFIAEAANEWNASGNVGLVVGATYPDELGAIREIAPTLPILVPGVGAQEGQLEASVKAGLDANGAGLLINASRAICYASSGPDFQDAARAAAISLRDQINQARGLN